MPGIDSYTKLLLHCDGVDGSTTFTDDSGNSHNATAYGNAQVDTVQSKFGGASLLLDGASDYISVPASSDFLFTGDFTIDCWIRFNTKISSSTIFASNYGVGGWFQCLIRPTNAISFDSSYSSITSDVLTWELNQWYHIAVVRYGSSVNIYRDGISVVSGTKTGDLNTSGSRLDFGFISYFGFYSFDGWIDEIRISNIARWTADFTPPTEEYTIETEISIDIPETISLSDSWTEESFPELKNISETVKLADAWTISSNPEQEAIENTISLVDSWLISTIGTVITKYATKLVTGLSVITKYVTNLHIGLQVVTKYATQLNLSLNQSFKYQTDLRLRIQDYDTTLIGSLDNYLVKKDGVTLSDVDYSTLNIILNLNSTPSRCEFILARHHDNLDETLTGSSSIITAENKIEVYDGTIKLFTGYITEINAVSSRDVVSIVAEDIRYAFARQSMELEYGGQWRQDSNGYWLNNPNDYVPDDVDPDHTVINTPVFQKFEKNISSAISEVLGNIGSLISGYDVLPFSGSFVPEYNKTYNDYGTLLDDLLRNTANVNWYIDENERLRFQKVAQGTIKTLNLSSLNVHRHPYDTILNDIQINHKPVNYAKSLNIKLGKEIKRLWRRMDIGLTEPGLALLSKVKDRINFGFQRWNGAGLWFYVGMNGTLYNYSTTDGWILEAKFIVQYLDEDSDQNLVDISVGSGLPTKTIFMTSYGSKIANMRWEELVKTPSSALSGVDETWLTEVTEESYNYTDFARDLANFELSQSNKLGTTANVDILLDAYEYYGLNFSDLINLGNTIKANTYTNNNGFPLNIQGIHMNLAKRTVTLNLTNYNKSWYAKTENILKTYQPPKYRYILLKYPVQQFSMGL